MLQTGMVAANGSSRHDPAAAGRSNGFVRGAAAFAGGAAVVLAAPFAILLIGLPIVLAVRGLLEILRWLFGAGG
ncbi:MAG: hypothetical protein IT176_15470 [Acidobacteria bacterium]|nr:hypothetical protein [Acidobacteriota bacterium]